MILRKFLLPLCLLGLGAPCISVQAAEKKVLVVTLTTGFRHSSIETGEKVIAELAEKSGRFSVDFVRQPVAAPRAPAKPDAKKFPKEADFKQAEAQYNEAFANYLIAHKTWESAMQKVAEEKLSMDKIRDYDGFIFCNTTGELPFPDPQGFIDLIDSGKAFIAMHSGSDTYHKFRPYVDMLGGEFLYHKEQVAITPRVDSAKHPAAQAFKDGVEVFDEIYILKSYHPEKTHSVLSLGKHPNDGTPGMFPISWTKPFGKGRVFYTSLGHREDVWDPTWQAGTDRRKNAPEVAEKYQQHLTQGIHWALGLEDFEAPVNNLAP